jgi:hypothetical protein
VLLRLPAEGRTKEAEAEDAEDGATPPRRGPLRDPDAVQELNQLLVQSLRATG